MNFRVGVLLLTSSLLGWQSGHSQRVVSLPSGDSVAVISAGPAMVPNKPTGFIVKFYPYRSLDDTLQLKRQALELRRILRPMLDSTKAPWIVLQATDQKPGPHFGFFHVTNYGFVFEERADGKWYFLHATEPIPDP